MAGDEDDSAAFFAFVGFESFFLFRGSDHHVPLGLTVPYWNLGLYVESYGGSLMTEYFCRVVLVRSGLLQRYSFTLKLGVSRVDQKH